MKNRKIVLVLIIALIILIVIAGIALLYLKTDLFKTNKQLFFKYISQFGGAITQFEDIELSNYFEKQKNSPYESSGKIDANIEVSGMETVFKNANKLNISFNGKTDIPNKKQEQKIQINYSDDVYFPVEYRRDNDLYALSSNIVVKKFVAVENNNLKDFFTKCGISDISDIPDKIEVIESEKITKEEWKDIGNRYFTILEKNLKDTNFSKLDKNKIVLTLTQEELKTIFLEILEELKDDTILVNDSTSIEEAIEKSKKIEATTDECLKIILHKENNKLLSIELNIEENVIDIQIGNNKITIISKTIEDEQKENITIVIEKEKFENSVNYNINCSTYEEEISIQYFVKAQYTGITTQNPQEKYVFGMRGAEDEKEVVFEYVLDTKKAFVNNVVIEDITTDNAVILNERDKEYITNLLNGIGNRIAQVNEMQMQQLGVEEIEHPLILATPYGYIYYQTYKSMQEMLTKVEQSKQQMEQARQEEEQQVQEYERQFDKLLRGYTVKE